MRRIILILLALMAAGIIEVISRCSGVDLSPVVATPTTVAPMNEHSVDALVSKVSDDKFVYCQSILQFRTDERRWIAYIQHPNGGREAINESLRRLTYREMPPKPWDDAMFDQYDILHMTCFTEWVDVFNLLDPLFLREGSAMLAETPKPSEADYRRAVLTMLFKKEAAIAEEIFPLKAELR